MLSAAQKNSLQAQCPTVRWQAEMAAYCTFRCGGRVEALVDMQEPEALAALLRWLHAQSIPWRVFGGGSNILFSSKEHEGVYIRVRSQAGKSPPPELIASANGECLVAASAAMSMSALTAWCLRSGLSGLEFMTGIPGALGGALRMNAGAFGHSMRDVIMAIEYLIPDGQRCLVNKDAIAFGYRHSFFPGEPELKPLILAAHLRLQPDERQKIQDRQRRIMQERKRKYPQVFGCAGSFFKNPPGDFAGRLIEAAGLKGLSRGKAMISAQHANFLVNTGGAKPEDILELMRLAQEKVQAQSGVLLEPEVRIL